MMHADAAVPLYEFLELSRFVDDICDPEHLEVGLQSIAVFEARWDATDEWTRDETDLLRVELLMRLGEVDGAAAVLEGWSGDGETGIWLHARLLEARGMDDELVELVEAAPRGAVTARTLQVVADALRRLSRSPGSGVFGHMRRVARLKEVDRFTPQPTQAALDALLVELSEASRSLSTLVEDLDDSCSDSEVSALVEQASGEIHVGSVRRQARSWLPIVGALFDAIAAGDAVAVRRCLAAGARVDDEQADGAPLWSAASHANNGPVIRALVESGADPEAVEADSRTPLMRAITRGHLENATTLIELGASTEGPARELALQSDDPQLLALFPSPARP